MMLAESALTQFLGLYNYWVVIFLMMTGFYIVIASENLIKTVIGLNIFQTSVFLLYITMGKVTGGTAPILKSGDAHGHDDHGHDPHGNGPGPESGQDASHAVDEHAVNETVNSVVPVSFEEHLATGAEQQLYTNPLPSVLMLTAIVVGIATTALALALIVRIREEYGTIEEDEILELDRNS